MRQITYRELMDAGRRDADTCTTWGVDDIADRFLAEFGPRLNKSYGRKKIGELLWDYMTPKPPYTGSDVDESIATIRENLRSPYFQRKVAIAVLYKMQKL